MTYGIRFIITRSLVLALVAVAQIYLFSHIRRAIQTSGRSNYFKSGAVLLIGITIGLITILNGYIISKPIHWPDPPLAAKILFFDLPAIWIFGSIFSALFLFLIQSCRKLKRIILQFFSDDQLILQPELMHVNQSRRYFIQAAIGGITTAPFLFSGYGAAYASNAYEVEELTLPFGHALRIVQLTDIHAGVYMTPKAIRHYVEQVVKLKPDVFVITGDFITNSISFLPDCLKELAQVKARYGTFATLGNHEHWVGKPNEFQAIFKQYKIELLQNEHRLIQTEKGNFAVAGIDDLEAGYPNLQAALHGLDPATPTILLSHHPEIFPQAADRGIALTLSGHYHGGQIKLKLPGLSLSLANLRTSYPEGHYRINSSNLYVSRGIGTTFTPVRLNAPPEVTLLHLT